jgi:hypothetical protein
MKTMQLLKEFSAFRICSVHQKGNYKAFQLMQFSMFALVSSDFEVILHV